jgi:hypothetical protein
MTLAQAYLQTDDPLPHFAEEVFVQDEVLDRRPMVSGVRQRVSVHRLLQAHPSAANCGGGEGRRSSRRLPGSPNAARCENRQRGIFDNATLV